MSKGQFTAIFIVLLLSFASSLLSLVFMFIMNMHLDTLDFYLTDLFNPQETALAINSINDNVREMGFKVNSIVNILD